MKTFNFFRTLTLVLFATSIFIGCSKESPETAESVYDHEMQIDVENGQEYESFIDEDEAQVRSRAQSSFRTLNQALRCTGLTIPLYRGLKTIYAPTDAAFLKLGLDNSNVCDLPIEDLKAILLYHVTDDYVGNKEVGCQETLDGNIVQITKDGRKRYVNGSKNVFTFLQCPHGQRNVSYALKVYAIDDVLTVPKDNIVNTAVGAAPEFTSLVAAVLAADPTIAAALSDEDAIFTVFAPTNEAFANLLEALGLNSLEEAVGAVGIEGLSTILLYHVIDGCAFSNDLTDGMTVETLQGESLTIDLANLAIQDKTTDSSGLITSSLDILTSNGVIHAIDKVLLPQAILDAL